MLELLFKLIWNIIKLPINLILFIPRLLLKIIISPKIKLWS